MKKIENFAKNLLTSLLKMIISDYNKNAIKLVK